MTPYRVVVVDDEPLAREGIRALLEEHSDFLVEALCGSGPEALKAVERHRPDLLFLDVQMPGMDGFEVLRRLGDGVPQAVIFVTAHDQHAVRAFEVSALDYLLKPFDAGRFHAALERARRRLAEGDLREMGERIAAVLRLADPSPRGAGSAGPDPPDRIAIRSRGCVTWIPVESIDRIEAAGYYAQIHAGGETHLLRESLGSLERRVGPAGFVRIHRSHLVPARRIRKLITERNGDATAVLDDGTSLPVGRSLTPGLRKLLG